MTEPQNDKKKTLMVRARTAVFFVVVMLLGLFGGPWTFLTLFTGIAYGAAHEFYALLVPRLQNLAEYRIYQIIAGLLAAACPVGVFLHISTGQELPWPIFIGLVVGVVLIAQLWSVSAGVFNRVATIVLGVFYIGLPMGLVVYMAHAHGFNPGIVLMILLLTWANDTGAYLVGMTTGRTPFWPRHSPKKTWEGTLGGLMFCLGAAYFLPGWLQLDLPVFIRLVLGLIVGVTGSLGDLTESLLKRQAGVKDSGTLMPGHGGLLDRFDAFIIEIPFVVAFLYAVGVL